MEGQITIFQYLEEKKRICNYSQHSCNKAELWKIAHTFNDFVCPEVCCRACDIRLCGARCNGSEEPQQIFEVDVKGLCDDAYCPKCGYSFKEWLGEVDIDCPECHTKLDWTFWHRLNDKEG